MLISRALDWTNLGSIEHALVDPRLTSDVFSYLSEEAFRREDAETVAFMLATCCLESMTVELAGKVARTDHGQRSLERLVAHNVFTFVDRATGTYRYHQLLRDYLRQWYANEYGSGAFRDLQTLCDRGSTDWPQTRHVTTPGSCFSGANWRCARATRQSLSTP